MSKTLTENNFGYHKKSCYNCKYLQIDNSDTLCESKCLLFDVPFMYSIDLLKMQARHRETICDAWEKQDKDWALFKHIHIENITSLL